MTVLHTLAPRMELELRNRKAPFTVIVADIALPAKPQKYLASTPMTWQLFGGNSLADIFHRNIRGTSDTHVDSIPTICHPSFPNQITKMPPPFTNRHFLTGVYSKFMFVRGVSMSDKSNILNSLLLSEN